MKCRRCRAENAPYSSSCWACGVRLSRAGAGQKGVGLRPEAMQYYHALASAPHRAWLDGLVLLSTVLFGLLLGYFVAEVIPGAGAARGAASPRFDLRNPFGLVTRTYRTLPVRPAGEAQEMRGVVIQVAEPRWSLIEGGREAPAGSRFLVVTAAIDNQGRQPFTYALGDWRVRDARGRGLAAEALRGPGWLSGGRVEPGQQVTATIAFLVPESDHAVLVTFSPAAFRSVLRWSAALTQ